MKRRNEAGQKVLTRTGIAWIAIGCLAVAPCLLPPEGQAADFEINAGLNDAWINPATAGQGFQISVFPASKSLFLTWFTFDTVRPPAEVGAMLGEPGHRWLAAQGSYDGDTAVLTLYVTRGGVFNAAEPVPATDPNGDGSITLKFSGCNAGLLSYQITSLGLAGQIPIQRIVTDNVPACESLAAADPAQGPPAEPAGLEGITAAHNTVRASVGVAPLTWDSELAAVAQEWAGGCADEDAPIGLIDHNPNRSKSYPGYVGENVFGHGGVATPQGAVDTWAAEQANYDYATNGCAAGKVCGHYTQVVWAATERVGCGIAKCDGMFFGATIVCNYSPGGNTGGRPY
jgi:uncharacterized protein YkwD